MKKIDYKALTPKTERGTYIIRIADYYPVNCGEQEYTEVDEATLDYLIYKRREEKRREKRDSRTLAAYDFDEVLTAVCGKIMTSSAADDFFSDYDCKLLYEAFSVLTEVQKRRVVLYFYQGFTYSKIAEMDNVVFTAAKNSIEMALEKMRKYIIKTNKYLSD